MAQIILSPKCLQVIYLLSCIIIYLGNITMGMCGNDRKHSSKIMVQGVYLSFFICLGLFFLLHFLRDVPHVNCHHLHVFLLLAKNYQLFSLLVVFVLSVCILRHVCVGAYILVIPFLV